MTRDLPFAPQRRTQSEAARSPRGRFTKATGLTFVGMSLAIALCGSMAIPANADELDDRQAQLAGEIANSNQSVASAGSTLDQATAALVAARQSLSDAQAVLAKAQAERDAAVAAEAKRAGELKSAEDAAAQARQKVTDGEAKIDAQLKKAALDARTMHQQNTGMMSIGMLFTDKNSADVSSRVQWAQTVYNANSTELNQLNALQAQLEKDQATANALEDSARQAREAAAAQVSTSQQAKQAADNAAAAVAAQVSANAAAEAAASQALAQARADLATKQSESADVAQRIVARNAEIERQRAIEAERQRQAAIAAAAEAERQRQAAEAAAEAERQRQAAEAAAAEAAAAAAARDREAQAAAAAREAAARQAQAAAQAAAAAVPAAAPAPAAAAVAASSGSMLARPADGPMTSPYGWRTNPVLGYSELHDGMDIGAGCGTPIYAAESGVVAEVGWVGGWGNRMVIDHGNLDGRQWSTGYNHAQGFTVSVGQWVSRGQQVGYIGTTGLSTGCHLHFHTWINGQTVDPASYVG